MVFFCSGRLFVLSLPCTSPDSMPLVLSCREIAQKLNRLYSFILYTADKCARLCSSSFPIYEHLGWTFHLLDWDALNRGHKPRPCQFLQEVVKKSNFHCELAKTAVPYKQLCENLFEPVKLPCRGFRQFRNLFQSHKFHSTDATQNEDILLAHVSLDRTSKIFSKRVKLEYKRKRHFGSLLAELLFEQILCLVSMKCFSASRDLLSWEFHLLARYSRFDFTLL